MARRLPVVSKSKRLWVTTTVAFTMMPACYYAIHMKLELVAALIAAGIFACVGGYVDRETKLPSAKAVKDEIQQG